MKPLGTTKQYGAPSGAAILPPSQWGVSPLPDAVGPVVGGTVVDGRVVGGTVGGAVVVSIDGGTSVSVGGALVTSLGAADVDVTSLAGPAKLPSPAFDEAQLAKATTLATASVSTGMADRIRIGRP
jgi:hypothetical protein